MKMNNFTKRMLTGMVFVIAVMGLIWWGYAGNILLMLFIYSGCLWEYFHIHQSRAKGIHHHMAFIFSIWVFFIFVLSEGYLWHHQTQQSHESLQANGLFILLMGIILPFVTWKMVILFSTKKNSASVVGFAFWPVVFFGIPCLIGAFNPYILLHPGAEYSPFAFTIPVLFMVWANDTFAYLTGKLIGRHKLMSWVSPNKTIEGFLGGIAGAILTSYLLYSANYQTGFPTDIPIYVHVIIGVGIGISATVGDLIQSAIKRKNQVKDSGRIFPGHGGMWDRFDGVLTAIPIYYIMLLISDYYA
jgi:phosphatidate cytidylyltransferase